LRTNRPYEIYTNLNFITFLGKNSDSYDRFVQRMCEMDESVIISLQILDQICGGPVKTENEKLISSSRIQMKTTMENLINHFKLYSQGFRIPESEFYVSLEAPKGEFGVYILSNGMPNIYRCKIRAPGFFHLQSINKMAKGLNIADVVTIVGSQDIVFGEVDR
jgi:NADH-quinone oxidoreductase subunit D